MSHAAADGLIRHVSVANDTRKTQLLARDNLSVSVLLIDPLIFSVHSYVIAELGRYPVAEPIDSGFDAGINLMSVRSQRT